MYNGYVPMKNMKWAICELERLQIQFDHPNPIRNASSIEKNYQFFTYTWSEIIFLYFRSLKLGETQKRCDGFPYDKTLCDECDSILVDCILNCDDETSCISICNRDHADCVDGCSLTV